MISDDPRAGPGTDNPTELLDVAESVVAAAPEDPDSWLMLGYAREAMAWGLRALTEWPRFPWIQVHPAVRNLNAWRAQDPGATFPHVPPDSIEMRLWDLPTLGIFENRVKRSRGARGESESDRVIYAHESFLSRVQSGQISLEVRADPQLAKRALNDTRLRLLEAAWEAYERAAKLEPSGAHLNAFDAALRRFAQLRWFRIPTDWPDFEPAILAFVPIKRSTTAFDCSVLLDCLESAKVDAWEVGLLRLECSLERLAPGFAWGGWSLDGGENVGFWESDEAARLTEEIWQAIEAGMAKLATVGSTRRYSFELPSELQIQLGAQRTWTRLPLQAWFEALSRSFEDPEHRDETPSQSIVDLLILLALFEFKRGRLGDAYPALWPLYIVEVAGQKAGLDEWWIEEAYRWHGALDQAWEEIRKILDEHPDLEFQPLIEVE